MSSTKDQASKGEAMESFMAIAQWSAFT